MSVMIMQRPAFSQYVPIPQFTNNKWIPASSFNQSVKL